MKLDSLTPDDKNFLDGFSRRVRRYLESFRCGTDWRVQFVDSFPEKPNGLGWCSAASRRMQFPLSLFDRPEAEIQRVVIHELSHAVLETRGMLSEEDPHGAQFQAMQKAITEANVCKIRGRSSAVPEKMPY
jgi:hypothetical protein